MPEISITYKQQSKLWINDAISYVLRKFESNPLSDEELSQAEFEDLKQLVESINHQLRGLEVDCVERNRENSGNEPGENLPIQHICRKCWYWITAESPRGAKITIVGNPSDFFDGPALTLTKFPPEDIVCPSCGFVNQRCGGQSFCDPEGVVVDSDPFPNLPSFAAPRLRHSEC